ncbi:MAG: M3 family oligoendopeptidase [Candidatus Thorarchaeota archaeon]
MSDADKMRWDLSQLVDFDDPAYVEERMTAAVEAADEVREKYRGKIPSFNAEQLHKMLKEIESFSLTHEGPLKYSRMLYDADMTKPEAKKLFNKFMQTTTLVNQKTAFVELEVGELLKKNPDIVKDPVLSEYAHWLERISRRIPHMLSEKEEELAIAKDKNGVRAWFKLQGDWLATRTFDIEVDGKMETMPYGKIISLYQSPDRDLRRRANEVVYKKLGEDHIVWSSALQSVCSDHLTMCKLRNWESPMHQSLIDNDVDSQTIEALMNTIEESVGIYRNYLKLKAKVLGLETLGNWDIDAPLPNAPDKKYTWEEARKIVTSAYSEFDEEIGGWIDEMYEKRHIDGEVREGKRSGAYCSTWHNGKSAFILQSFNGILGDLYTQAHELGHAMHAYLGTRAQGPLNYEIGSCIAETGSIFGELLLTEKLLATVETKEEKQAVLATVLDEFGAAAFQVSTRVWFETMLYQTLQDGFALDGEKVSELWLKARDKMYGDAVEWLPEMRWWWTMKLHFYIPNYRYYNYPYVYAQLFVYAMYRLYREQGKDFVPKLKALLGAGSSKSPRDLAAEIGFDVTTEEFWQKGIDQFNEFVEQFEETL